MKKAFKEICYGPVRPPRQHWPMEPVSLTDETMELRKEKVLTAMKHQGLEVLCIYADREHGGNFGYLTGFEPRFEEAVLVLHQDGTAFLLLGNESLRMGSYCRLPNTVIHVPHFSLPNQPMETAYSLKELFAQANLSPGIITGIVGWKLFTSTHDCNRQLYEIPSFLVDCIQEITGSKAAYNAGELFLHPDTGVRVTNTANEIAHFEYGASLASDCVLRAMDEIAVGKIYQCRGSPRRKEICLGDPFSLTMGLRGGLTSRAGYVAARREDLPEKAADYMEKLAIPYFAAAVNWYETICIGMTGGALYETIEHVIPRAEYGWSLNPGHLTSSEEWLASPVFKDSGIPLKSGMMLQMDILPKRVGYGGANAEDGIVLADRTLQQELAREYPRVWQRMCERKRYMKEELGITLKDEVFPLSDAAGYYRPWLFKKSHAFYKEI